MTGSPGWTVAAASAVPEQTPPQPRPVVMRQCAICLRRGPDLGLTSEERQAIAIGRSELAIPPDAVSAALVRWHDPQTPDLAVTREFRCEDHERCWVRVIEFGDPWPVDDRRPRYDPDRPRITGTPAMTLPEALASRSEPGDDVGRSRVEEPDSPAIDPLPAPPVEDVGLDWGAA